MDIIIQISEWWIFFRIMKMWLFFLFLFAPCSVDDSMSACRNQHSCCVFWFCMPQTTICFPFLCMCAVFFSFRGHAPLPNPPPLRITNSAGWQQCHHCWYHHHCYDYHRHCQCHQDIIVRIIIIRFLHQILQVEIRFHWRVGSDI